MSDLVLSFGRLEAVLSTYFRIDPERGGTFRARIKQLQRLNFPSGVNVGRGVKFEYGLDHALKLIVALELMALGLPAKFVTDIVETSWRRFAVGFQISPKLLDPMSIDDIYAFMNIDLLGNVNATEDCVLIYDFNLFSSDVVPVFSKILSLNLTVIHDRFAESLELIRISKAFLYANIMNWGTGFRELSDSLDNDWLRVSHQWLEGFKPKGDNERGDLPF